MKAKLLFKDKYIYKDGAIREIVIWRLPEVDSERLHGLKYTLFYGFPNQCLIRYDNEQGKGDHRHYSNSEEAYTFESVSQLMKDFKTDIEKLRGKKHE